MSMLFSPANIGSLELPNRLVRSATAERLAERDGKPFPELKTLYQELVDGGVGLIITGHMYVHPSGKAHPEMTGIYKDDLVPSLAQLADAVHQQGGRIAVQINHGGMQCDKETVLEAIAPSDVEASSMRRPARVMTEQEIGEMIDAYGQAARRAKQAGFDAVQIHAAHGYLISQFLSPLINKRSDRWGGDIHNRMRFLRHVSQAVRAQVGADYPVLIKLGMMDGGEGGLSLDDGLRVVAALESMHIDGVELSGGIGGKGLVNSRKGIRSEADEAYFLPFAQRARPITDLPILLVGGLRSLTVMEHILQDGFADFISVCRPLINDPYLPKKMRAGILDKSGCLSANNCWPTDNGMGIACKCPLDRIKE